jgi:hypothetical protein
MNPALQQRTRDQEIRLTHGSDGRRWRFVAVLALVALFAACRREDPRIKNLRVGIPKDSVLVLMGGATAQPFTYLMDGQYIEAMIYRRPEIDGAFEELERRDMTPVVVVDGRLTGWGWDHWDSVASVHRIEVVPKE